MASLDRTGRRRWPISLYLAVTLGTLVLVAMAVVFVITMVTAARNTLGLLAENGEMLTDTLAQQTRRHLETASDDVRYLHHLITTGVLDLTEAGPFLEVATHLVTTKPQLSGIVFLRPNKRAYIVTRSATGEVGSTVQTLADDPDVDRAIANAAKSGDEPFWGEPVFAGPEAGSSLTLRRPIHQGDELTGLIVAVVSVRYLSAFVSSLEVRDGQQAFILYGRDQVLAHPLLQTWRDDVDNENPLIDVASFGDPVIQGMWDGDWRSRLLDVTAIGHYGWVDDVQYIYLYRQLDGLADRPLIVGSYFPEDSVNQELERLELVTLVSLIAIALALIMSFVIGRRMAKPIQALADAAGRLSHLEFDHARIGASSRVDEIDRAISAFDQMSAALARFARYVPSRLVRRLLDVSGAEAVPTETRELTVMFTDIAGFTTRAQSMTAEETAAFLNDHFHVLEACVEDARGTLDKFLGDGVLAFWGAPEPMADHARRALAAADAIARALQQENAGDQLPLRLRIGVHTGPVVVGDIGGRSRVDYTIVGDAVNTAQRLQVLARDLGRSEQVAVMVSAETANAAGVTSSLVPIGEHLLKGRDEPIQVYLLPPPS
ncbi:MAG: adenylate/guanylate cyclase domain-containing protein [Geminicoccaceae bacterium]